MFLSSPGLSGLVGFYPGYSTGERAGNDPTEWMHAVVKMQTSNSAGTVRLNSSDPRIRPNINFNYFTESAERDLDAIVEGIEMLRRAFDATGVPYTQLSPDPESLRQSIQDLAFSHHASSTCAIGADDDENSCVDSRFRCAIFNKVVSADYSRAAEIASTCGEDGASYDESTYRAVPGCTAVGHAV
ncbi:hypothetical protein H9Q73_006089 [Fusarium xylarioides]|nr:hypothetical protein H9Q73_006089 [Fusarium xylarioides]